MNSPFNFQGINYGGWNGAAMTMPNIMPASNPVAAAIQSYSANQGPASQTGGLGEVATGVSGVGAGTNTGAAAGLGFNLPTLNLALGGLQTIGSLWNAWESRKLAQEEFAFKKGVTNTNLNNQIQSYNTNIEDRARARAVTEGQAPGVADAYVAKNRLSR